MSYDLGVYAPVAHDPAGLRHVVAATPGLAVGDANDEWLEVVRQSDGEYCCTVEGPWPVEDEDVPPELARVAPDAAHLYQVNVEGSAAESIPPAIDLATRLAASLGGVAFDHQTAEVWTARGERSVALPPKGERVSVVEVRWYLKPDADLGATYLDLCRRLLPEALPRRYGEFEPLGHRLAESGDEAFAAAWREAKGTLSFAATKPCLGGSLDRVVTLDLHATALADPAWRAALRGFFVALAERTGAFYASAEVNRGYHWNGRTVSLEVGTTEWLVSPLRRDEWFGLPPYPVWWAWYGDPYRDLVASRLSGGDVTEVAGGLLHTLHDTPLDRDALTRLVTRRHGLRRKAEWAPAELLATVEPNDGRIQPVPLSAAPHVPAGLP